MVTTVAIIEDHPIFMQLFAEALRPATDFFLAGMAINGADAMKLIDQHHADIYLVDLGLPDISGIEVIRHALKTHPASEAMVISSFYDDGHIIASIEAGATGYLTKDNTPLQIVAAIRQLRDGGSPISPGIARKILNKLQSNAASANPLPPSAVIQDSLAAQAVNITRRESEILWVLAKGLSFTEIADLLSISSHTVARHVKNIYRKLAVNSRGEAVYEATRLGLLYK